MSLLPEQWAEVNDKVAQILDAQPLAITHPIPLLLTTGVQSYEWPGLQDERVALRRFTDTLTLLGTMTLKKVTSYSLLLDDGESYRDINFNRPLMTVGPVFNAVGADNSRDALRHRAERFDTSRWPARPKDYERLYDEVGRGYRYFLTDDNS